MDYGRYVVLEYLGGNEATETIIQRKTNHQGLMSGFDYLWEGISCNRSQEIQAVNPFIH